MDPAECRWLEDLVEVCDRALAKLPGEDPPLLQLIANLHEVRAQLAVELEAARI